MKHIAYYDLARLTHAHSSALKEAAARVIDSGRYLRGECEREFEKKWATFVGTKHCVAVGNGLDALTLALMALKRQRGWQQGDEVIVPALTFVATALAVARAGLVPVMADVGEADGLIDLDSAEHCLTPRTRAIIPVHLYGAPCPMPVITEWARQRGLSVVEDAAQDHGATVGGRCVGSWGDIGCFSFYPGKNLGALGDGGAVCTNSETLAIAIRQLANYGATEKYVHQWQGMNSRMDELQAAILTAKTKWLDGETRRRREIAERYGQGIRNPKVRIPYGGKTEQSVFHIYPLRCPEREALQAHLLEHGIETLIHYPLPLHRQPAFFNAECRLPKSERWASEELSLPIGPYLTNQETDQIIEAINTFK